MGTLGRFLAKYHQLLDRRHAKTIKRKQFNMTIDEGLVLAVKLLAETLEVPRYVVTEHALQLGCYQIYAASKDPERLRELQEHLVKVHLLGSELQDDESILRLGG